MRPDITSINIQYQGNVIAGVQVYYNGYDTQQSMSIGGYVSLTATEYKGNEALSTLAELIKSKVVNKLTEPVSEAEPADPIE